MPSCLEHRADFDEAGLTTKFQCQGTPEYQFMAVKTASGYQMSAYT